MRRQIATHGVFLGETNNIHNRYGPPTIAVTIPTGTSKGMSIMRPTVSASTMTRAPARAELINGTLRVDDKCRAISGPISPTSPTGPATATAIAVSATASTREV